ncbi:MAG: aldo/keto reductase [Salinivirgaceae bacterium]
MEKSELGNSTIRSSRLIYGCMRVVGDNSKLDREKGKNAIRTAVDEGFNHFDHADIYAAGQSELLFSEVLTEAPQLRDQIIITSKCGIRLKGDSHENAPKRYDFSEHYITASVEGSLMRLKTDYLDVLLLHRPDFLMNPKEVANVFQKLHKEGKVKHFGVSNFSPSQVRLLQSHLSMPLIVNQVEINIHNTDAFTNGILDQCQELNISPQAWSPLSGAAYEQSTNTLSPKIKNGIEKELCTQSEKYRIEKWVVVLAWLLKHPATIFPVIGTTNSDRIKTAKQALNIDYQREDWYRLWEARNGQAVQ